MSVTNDTVALRRTLLGQSFMGVADLTAVGGAGYANAQLWNPAASGILLLVRQISFVGYSTVMTVNLGFNQSEFNTAAGTAVNKKSNATGGNLGLLRYDATGTHNLNPASALLGAVTPQITDIRTFDFNDPLVIAAGWGLCAWGQTGSVGYRATIEWDEVNG